MAICQIWEDYSSGNNRQQVAMVPGGAVQNVSFTSTAGASAAVDNATIGVRLLSDTDCWFLCSKAATAATSSNGIRLIANQGEYFGVPPGGAYRFSFVSA